MKKKELSKIVTPLLEWYQSHARILPWRDEPTPYRVWVSEIMLQQTRVQAVIPYFHRFIENLPDISSLANANEEKLLKLWEGLGYYSRVKNLQKTAELVMDQYNGQLPDSYEELLKLPGIGSYTAGAIVSIAYGVRVCAVDGNVMRVISRVLASYDNISEQKVKHQFEQRLQEILPFEQVGDFNQALMELGATVCLPNGTPKCAVCPLQPICKAHQNNIEVELPIKQKKKARIVEQKTILLITCHNEIAIRKRNKSGLLAGMWELPNLEGAKTLTQVKHAMEEWGIVTQDIKSVTNAKHIFTHREWHMIGYSIEAYQYENKSDLVWVTYKQLKEQYALPSAFGAYIKELEIKFSE